MKLKFIELKNLNQSDKIPSSLENFMMEILMLFSKKMKKIMIFTTGMEKTLQW